MALSIRNGRLLLLDGSASESLRGRRRILIPRLPSFVAIRVPVRSLLLGFYAQILLKGIEKRLICSNPLDDVDPTLGLRNLTSGRRGVRLDDTRLDGLKRLADLLVVTNRILECLPGVVDGEQVVAHGTSALDAVLAVLLWVVKSVLLTLQNNPTLDYDFCGQSQQLDLLTLTSIRLSGEPESLR